MTNEYSRDKHDSRFDVRVTDATYFAIKGIAEELDLSLNAYIRQLIAVDLKRRAMEARAEEALLERRIHESSVSDINNKTYG